MPAVLTFWMLPEEEELLLSKFLKLGPIVAYPTRWMTNRKALDPKPIHEFIREINPSQLSFTLEALSYLIPVESIERNGQIYFKFPYEVCTIHYRRGTLTGNKLYLSNLSADWTQLNEDHTAIIYKSQEFIDWGKKIFAIARKLTPGKHTYYRISKGVEKRLQEGAIELST